MLQYKVYAISFANVYDCYIAKAERKGHAKSQVDEIIRSLTGYFQKELANGRAMEKIFRI